MMEGRSSTMNQFILLLTVCALWGPMAQAQASARRVHAQGNASVFAAPDQAMVDANVTTQALTAQEAAAQNANQVGTLLTALRKLLGADADIQTVGYYITPNLKYPQ